MNHSDFVHLHVHTQYSLLDGACRIKKLIQKAKEYNMPALGMTDHGNIFGAIDFYNTAIANDIKPIIGCEAYVLMKGSRFERTPRQRADVSHLVLIAKNNIGYRNLLKLVSKGYLEGFYYFPRMDKKILQEHSEGLICTSACLKGEVAQYLMQGNFDKALKAADDLRQIFGKDNFYLEIMDHGIDEQKQVNEGILKISKQLNIPMIATNDVHYMEQCQSHAHEALLCIQTQTTLDDPKRMRLATDQFYFKDPLEMRKTFSWAPESISNTVALAEKCEVDLSFDKFHLPKFDPPQNKTKEQYLRELCQAGLRLRYREVTPEIKKRLEHELAVIEKMGFVGYFLIVSDFIKYATSQHIPVGPGRGSAAGSLVSYLIGITDLDPIKYGLLFERFLNPDRAGMPDIDIDFCYERRSEVIDYVTEKYGKENVAQIITFGTMQARAAIRDVGRAMGASYGDVDRIAKLVPNDLGITLDGALEKEPRLQDLCDEDSSANEIIQIAKTLEGLNRHASTHAAGVVISDKPLDEYVPLFKTSDGQITTGFTMDGIAKIGLLKMDFLGLRTLTVISEAVKLIEKRHNVKIDVQKLSLEDEKTYKLLSDAHTFGVFQLESAGMRDLLKKIKPSEFEDIVSVLALYRPGPMGSGMLDDFIQRKAGEVHFEYDHPKLESVLKNTYGIIVYQEQVMQIAVVLAGFSLVQADHLRRAMGKKIVSVMQKMRVDFVEGCKRTSQMSEEKATRMFDLIDYFSGYGFNRSHSAAYALITYQTAYLKANYPVEFMAAILTSERDNTDKIVDYVRESEVMGIKINPPDVNKSLKEFSVVDEHAINYGLLAVKNIGSSAIDSIVENRKGTPYKSLYDLCERVDLRLVNRKVVESLIKCGAVDEFGVKRSQLMAILEQTLEMAARSQKEKASGQVSFFDMADSVSGFQREGEDLPDIKEFHKNQILAFEKEMLGFYVSGHPLNHYRVEIKEFTDIAIKNLIESPDGKDVRLVGLIQKIKLTNTKKTNERMAILKIEDMEGEVEAVVFPSVYAEIGDLIKEGEVVFVKGKVNFRDGEPKLILNDMTHINGIYNSIKAINVDITKMGRDRFEELKKKLRNFPGKIPIYLKLNTQSQKGVKILVGEDLHVTPNDHLMNDIKELVGEDNFSVSL